MKGVRWCNGLGQRGLGVGSAAGLFDSNGCKAGQPASGKFRKEGGMAEGGMRYRVG